jgi:hypothetical protein
MNLCANCGQEMKTVTGGHGSILVHEDGYRSCGSRRTASNYYEIQPGDVGQSVIRSFGYAWSVTGFIGRILPMDVGKRVYMRNRVLQVESNEQFQTRINQDA